MELLWDARQAYARAAEARKQGRADAPNETALKEAYESLLAAEGSDWCWWFGPEHSTPTMPSSTRSTASTHRRLSRARQIAPEELAKPHKAQARARPASSDPRGFLTAKIDGHDTSYFEWLGLRPIFPEAPRRFHARPHLPLARAAFTDLKRTVFSVRVDLFPEGLAELEDPEFRVTIARPKT